MMSNRVLRHTTVALTVALLLGTALPAVGSVDMAKTAAQGGVNFIEGTLLPTGKRITPEAAPGSIFQPFNPGLKEAPDYLADHAVDTSLSPDGKILLILTSGYNRYNDAAGKRLVPASNEYVFIFDISGQKPVQKQVIQVPNTFNGIAWNPKGHEFYVAGGVDDNVHVYGQAGGQWSELLSPIGLGHNGKGQGVDVKSMAAGLAVNASGTQLLVANYENDSISLIDLVTRQEIAELDLRPGKIDPSQSGVAGGTYPFAVGFLGDNKAYVSSQRDRELIVVGVNANQLTVDSRIKTQGQPNKMTFNRAGDRLYVACDNSDTVLVVDTTQNQIVEEILTTSPNEFFPKANFYKGANPNNVALSPDQGTLFVTNGGTNSVAVIQLGSANKGEAEKEDEDEEEAGEAADEAAQGKPPQSQLVGSSPTNWYPKAAKAAQGKSPQSRVIGLIPTGWYPNAVAVKPDGGALYVVNGKSEAGPNPQACRNTLSIAPGSSNQCNAANQYSWQLEKAGFLTLPTPNVKALVDLTWQTAYNNNFPTIADKKDWEATMAFLRSRIQHVIYVVKENRTYDQVHGDLPRGNGDPSLAILSPYSPNHNKIATQFVLLDNFYDSGETSGVGWNWTTAARTTDFTEKTQPVNYAGRGLSYDWEGSNRNVPVSLSPAERATVGLTDPNVLAGTADVAAPDSRKGEVGTGYLWDAALRAGLTIRNYGFFVGNIPSAPVVAYPFAQGIKQAIALKEALKPHTDEYFRGYDQNNADFYLFKEWEREFDGFVQQKKLPNLSFVRFPHDHFGNFSTAKFGVNTVETQMADNDYATGLLIEKVAKSPFKDTTLIFVIEDDAQNGGDHVDAHRSIGYIVGPYVKQGVVVSTHYTTVSMVRTIQEVLGLPPLGINDGLTAPMADLFDPKQAAWTYQAVVPSILYTTQLELPPKAQAVVANAPTPCLDKPSQQPSFWDAAMKGQNFSVEDKLDSDAFNRAIWLGLKGEKVPYPEVRHGRDLREGRESLLKSHAEQIQRECVVPTNTASTK